MIKNITFGSDAEVIVKTVTGMPFPVCGLLGGTKENPRKLSGSGFMIQEDNVLLEYNVPVTNTVSAFAKVVSAGFERAIRELPPTLIPTYVSTAVYDPLFANIPQVMQFGCEPDYNAWTLEQNPRPDNPEEPMLRSAAGHIHIGWDKPTQEDQIALVKALDLFVGLPSVWESEDRQRRRLYGKAGAFRPKEYGIEYRVLDNYWIFGNNSATRVGNRVAGAISFVNKKGKILDKDQESIQTAINTYNIELAKRVASEYGSY